MSMIVFNGHIVLISAHVQILVDIALCAHKRNRGPS